MKRARSVLSRKKLRKLKQSSTPGNTKGLVPDPHVRMICARNRSYKDTKYHRWADLYPGDEKVRNKKI